MVVLQIAGYVLFIIAGTALRVAGYITEQVLSLIKLGEQYLGSSGVDLYRALYRGPFPKDGPQ